MIAGRFLFVYFLTAVLDYAAFWVVLRATEGNILAAQLAGRAVSVPFNYLAVRAKVFRSQAPHSSAGWKFIVLYALAFLASWGLIEALKNVVPLSSPDLRVIVAKMAAEGGILIAKFFIQKHLIFRETSR